MATQKCQHNPFYGTKGRCPAIAVKPLEGPFFHGLPLVQCWSKIHEIDVRNF